MYELVTIGAGFRHCPHSRCNRRRAKLCALSDSFDLIAQLTVQNPAAKFLGDHQTRIPDCGNSFDNFPNAESAMSATAIPSWVVRQLSRYKRASSAYSRIRSNRRHPASNEGHLHTFEPPTPESESNPEWITNIFDSVSVIDQADWDSIVEPGNLLKSHAYLSAVEASEIEHVRYYFPVIADRSGKVLAHACVYVIDTDLSQLLPHRLSQLAKLIRKAWKRFLIFKVTDCATPLSTGNSISTTRQIDKSQLISRLVDAVETISKHERCRLIVIRDFLEGELAEFDGLLTKGYKLVSNMPVARIHVRWKSYEEYLESMRARYRTDIKRRLRRAHAAGQHARKLERFGESADLWASQAQSVQEKTKGFRREVLTPQYYASMDRLLGDRSMLVIADRAGLAVAHGMLLQDNVTTTATYFGRNPGPAQHEWFQLVNEVIRLGIENQSKYINLGLGSYDAKMNVGAQIEPLFVYSKSSIRIINWLMCRIPQTMNRTHPVEKQIFHGRTAGRN